jgi:dTDP-4-dehydrorhamnose 3,5-epimerase
MQFLPTRITDVLLIEPKVFGDERGLFFESFRQDRFDEAVGHPVAFVQENHSKSTRGVLRGLHFQLPPKAQGKLVRVVAGEVFDVAVDLRRNSPTFGRWIGEVLSASNRKQLWIPPGFGHGFLTLTESAEFLYKTTDYYSPEHERALRWDDPDIAIAWPLAGQPILSGKDRQAPCLADTETFN